MSGTTQQPPTHSLSPELPRAVREAAERANRAVQQMNTAPAQGEPQGEPGIQMLKPVEERPEPPHNVQQDGQQAEPPAQQEQPARQEGQPQPPQQDDAEHRYRSLKGRFDAEMAKRDAQIEGLRDLIANLQSAPPPPPQNKPVETFSAGPDTELSEDERRDYGPDLIGLVEKIAKRVAYDVAGKVREEVQQVQRTVGSVQETTNQTAHERFLAALTSSVSDWETMNGDPEFLRWLGQPDPYSGVPRQSLLNKAVEDKSAARAAAFFQGYKRELQAVSPQGSQPAATSPASQPGQRVPLESLAAPGRAKPGASGAPQDKPTYTRSAITKFYDDVRRGAFRGREAEQARMEADIIAATREGRIM